MALLKAAVGEGASFAAVALNSQEMKATEGASRFSRWWRRQRPQVKRVVVGVVVAGACIAVVGGTGGIGISAGMATCTVAF
jgi:hypothetical protein